MKIFEGKTPTERNKIIAAAVLGVLVLIVAGYNIMTLYPSKKTVVAVTASSPMPVASPRANQETAGGMPGKAEEISEYTTTPVVYNVGSFYAPDAGRNIFAFYEPPPPTPYVAPPVIFKASPTPPLPTPTPTPPLLVAFITPQSVYAGSKTFHLEVDGDKFTPESLIYLNGSQLPTTFVSPQKVVADVPSNMIAGAGTLQLIVRTPDGALYSNQVIITVQAPPRPQLQYIGMIARKRFNNDTAYFQEKGKDTPIGARLNDVVGGRFRIVSISASEVVLEDVNLSFRHKLALYRPAPGQSAGSGGYPNNGNPNEGMYSPFNPGTYVQQGENPPGIPNNIPRYIPPQQPPQQQQQQQPKPKPARTVNNNDDEDDGDN